MIRVVKCFATIQCTMVLLAGQTPESRILLPQTHSTGVNIDSCLVSRYHTIFQLPNYYFDRQKGGA